MNCTTFKASKYDVKALVNDWMSQSSPGNFGGTLMKDVIDKMDAKQAAIEWIKCFTQDTKFGSKVAETNEELNKQIEYFFDILNKFKIEHNENFDKEFTSQFTETFSKDSRNKSEIKEGDEESVRSDEAIDGTFLEIAEKKLFDKLRVVFGTSGTTQTIISKFKSNVVEHVYFNLEQGKIVYNNVKSLNQSLSDLKSNYFKILLDYLQNNVKDFTSKEEQLYNSSGFLNSDFMNIMNTARELIDSNIENGTHFNQIKNGWNSLQAQNLLRGSKYKDIANQKYYNFVNAFFVLSYFDTLMEAEFPSAKFSKSQYNSMPKNRNTIKYNNGVDKKGRYTGFTDDNKRNGFTEAGREATAFLEALPLLSYNKKLAEESNFKRTGLHIDLIRTTRVFNKLRELVYNFDNDIMSNASQVESSKLKLNNAILNLHLSPKENVKTILDSLFLGKNPIINTLKTNRKLSENEIDTLFSLWYNVYNTSDNEGWSIMKIENKDRSHKFSENLYSDYITGLIDRVTDLKYLSVQYENGELKLNFRKKFNDNKNVFETINKINQYALNKADNIRKNLFDKYKINGLDESDERNKNGYSVSLDKNLEIIIRPNNNKSKQETGILSTSPENIFIKNKNGEVTIYDYFKKRNFLNQDDIDEAKAENTELNKLLTFFKDSINIDFLSDDNLSILQFSKMDSTNTFGNLAFVSFKAMLINNLKEEHQENSSLPKYAIEKYSNIFNQKIGTIQNGKFEKNKTTDLVEELGLNNYILKAVSKDDGFFDSWASAVQLYNGELLKSTSRNFEGNAEQNGRTNFLGAQIHTYISKIKSAKKVYNDALTAIENRNIENEERIIERNNFLNNTFKISSGNLLFAQQDNIRLLKGSVMSSDIKARDESVKAIKSLKAGELLYTHIFHNFYGTLYNEEKKSQISDQDKLKGRVLIQPTVYSDKSSIIDFIIELGEFTVGNTTYNLNKLTNKQTVDAVVGTVGKMYQDIASNVIMTYNKIFAEDNIHFNSLDEINNYLRYTFAGDEFSLATKAQDANVKLTQDLHYVIENGRLGINPLLYYYTYDLYGNSKNLEKRLNKEKINFINSIIKSGVYFQTDDATISNVIKEELSDDSNKWIKNNTLVLAIVTKNAFKHKIVQGNEITEDFDSIEINPILEKFFNVQNLIGLNLRLTLTGSDIGHPVEKATFFKKKNLFIDKLKSINAKELNNLDLNNLSYVELRNVIQTIKDKSKKEKALAEYEKLMMRISGINANGTEGAQLKRNAIIPATLQYVQQNCINGIPKKVKIAVIKDIRAYVNTFNGESASEDSQDGSALQLPFFAYLINRSLQDQAVGEDMKPIWHNYDLQNSTAGFLKYAMFTMTNLRMMQSLGSNVNLYNLFKKMCNQQWTKLNKNGQSFEIDLIKGKRFGHTKGNQPSTEIDFKNDILQNERLIYGIDNNYREITDLKKTVINGKEIYYTIENTLSADAEKQNTVKVYHLFDGDSNHYRLNYNQVIEHLAQPKTYHTINSLFELHSALGGIFCSKFDGKRYVLSEKNNEAIGNYINIIGFYRRKDGSLRQNVNIVDDNINVKNENNEYLFVKSDYMNQQNYYQPLKELFIGVAANPSAMKTGVTNVNPVERWSDSSNLNYMEFDSDGFGIQQDSDHEADEAELTEPTQVMTALDQGGYLHSFAKQIYQSLGKTTMAAANVELETVKDYLTKQKNGDPNAINTLYDLVGRIIINNLDSRDGNMDLSQEILSEVKKEFNVKSNDHSLDELKIAFSDPNLFGHVVPAIVSVLNNKGIRRKNPGSGMVMVPSYRMFQVYNIGGKPLIYTDLIKQIIKERNINEIIEQKKQITKTTIESGKEVQKTVDISVSGFSNDQLSTNNINNYVQEYLQKQQEDLNTETIKQGKHLFNDFDLNDIVNITPEISSSKNGVKGEPFTAEIYINSIDKYYLFKDSKWLDLSGAKNKIKLIYNELGEEVNFDFIENQLQTIGLSKWIETFKDQINANERIKRSFKKLANNNFLKLYDFNTLHYFENIIKPKDLAPTRIQFTEGNRKKSFYDIPMIKLAFKTKKNVPKREMQALFKDLKGGKYYDNYIRQDGQVVGVGNEHSIQNLTYYKPQAIISNLVANKFNGNYNMTLNEFEQNNLFNAESFQKTLKTNDVPTAKLRFLKTNGNHTYIKFDSINKSENNSDYRYEKESVSNFRTVKEAFGDLTIYKTILLNKANEDVYEIGRDVEMINYKVEKNKIINENNEIVNDKQYKIIGGKVFKSYKYLNKFIGYKKSGETNTVFSIDRNMIDEFTKLTGESANTVLRDTITNLYRQDTYIAFDQTLDNKNDKKYLLKGISDFDPNLKQYVDAIVKDDNPDLTNILQEYEKEIRTSFEISKYIIASRIPAQTLQSFMPMEVVGYTQMEKAVAYVSSIQTFLQGSDYKTLQSKNFENCRENPNSLLY